MIQLDPEYANTEPVEGSAYEPPPSCGYVMKCLKITEITAFDGSPQVVLELDIAEGPHTGKLGKYPIKHNQMLTGKSLGYFKGMLKAFADSNPGMLPVVVNGQFNPQGLLNKFVGANLRTEEYYPKNSNELKTSFKPAFLCGADRVRSGEIKPLPVKKAKPPVLNYNPDSFQGNAPMPHQHDERNPPPNTQQTVF